ncbi:Deoxyribonuclease-2-like protein, partial [Leptotrombidium deliense]
LTMLVFAASLYQSKAKLFCKDDDGNDVDWFIVYKLPKLNKQKHSIFSDGLRYEYISGPKIDGESMSKQWKLSEKLISKKDSILGKTLKPLYVNGSLFTTLYYSDQPPDSTVAKSTRAHAKGVLAMDKHSGYILTHSIPRFPNILDANHYEFPSSGAINGQSALCVSFMPQKYSNIILTHLKTIEANIYYYENNGVLKHDSIFNELVENEPSDEYFAYNAFRSYKGQTFYIFSKSAKAGGDLYSEYIAPNLKSSLLVLTWRRGTGGRLASHCESRNKVLNIDVLQTRFHSLYQHNEQWSYSHDHAKWAVSPNKESAFVCIADNNRMQSQFKRGGGSFCIRDKKVWVQFRKMVVDTESC